jgi:hypothetical protein
MTLTSDGIAAGWAVEHMPKARHMGDGVLLPDGRVLIINGASTGVAGYGAVSNQIGASDADNASTPQHSIEVSLTILPFIARIPRSALRPVGACRISL